jgi:hypothetical protein
MSVESDPGFWKWVAGSVLGAIGGLFGYHKYIEARIDKKADKHVVNNQLQEIKNEQAVQRGHIGKVFDQMRENEQRAQDRHERLMEKIAERRS